MRRWADTICSRRPIVVALVGLLAFPIGAFAEEAVFETFENKPETRWEFFADTVMGGVSTGKVTFERDGAVSFARMTGQVSTENRGGFIQFRRRLTESLPAGTKGVRLIVRGNNQRYFVHVRTKGTLLPWQYYQSGFDATSDWSEIRLPLSSFKASGSLMRSSPSADSLTSVGIVAFGRDHEARIDVREVGFY